MGFLPEPSEHRRGAGHPHPPFTASHAVCRDPLAQHHLGGALLKLGIRTPASPVTAQHLHPPVMARGLAHGAGFEAAG